jgi:hypothetical protein
MIPVDRQFVISGWSSSFRTSKTAGLIAMSRWSTIMHTEIGCLIDRSSVTTIVAYEPGEYIETIRGPRPFHYGFLSIGEPVETSRGWLPYVLYCYVKSGFRRGRERFSLERGYAAQLFAYVGIDPRDPFVYACSTGVVADLAAKIPLAEFNPLPARFQESRT